MSMVIPLGRSEFYEVSKRYTASDGRIHDGKARRFDLPPSAIDQSDGVVTMVRKITIEAGPWEPLRRDERWAETDTSKHPDDATFTAGEDIPTGAFAGTREGRSTVWRETSLTGELEFRAFAPSAVSKGEALAYQAQPSGPVSHYWVPAVVPVERVAGILAHDVMAGEILVTCPGGGIAGINSPLARGRNDYAAPAAANFEAGAKLTLSAGKWKQVAS